MSLSPGGINYKGAETNLSEVDRSVNQIQEAKSPSRDTDGHLKALLSQTSEEEPDAAEKVDKAEGNLAEKKGKEKVREQQDRKGNVMITIHEVDSEKEEEAISEEANDSDSISTASSYEPSQAEVTAYIDISCRIYLLVGEYEATKPGPEPQTQALIKQFYSQEIALEDYTVLASTLRHRISLAWMAEEFLFRLGLWPYPTFASFDTLRWHGIHRRRDTDDLDIHIAYQLVFESGIFLYPPCEIIQEFWKKPAQYLAAAAVERRLQKEEFSRRLKVLVDALRE